MDLRSVKVIDYAAGDRWAAFRADCVDFWRQLPPNCIDLAVYSPPFANLYCYSDSERDMGNAADDADFLAHYRFLVRELHRTMRPGRIVAVHCKDLVNYRGRDGMAGLRDFPGDLIRVHQDEGFAFHSRFTIWKCPVTEMQRTKAHGLLYKQLRADSTFSRQGLAEYVVCFRKWARDDEAARDVAPVTHTRESFPLEQWQEWASPVWNDIDQTNVLNCEMAREDRDEKHMCPLQLDVIERLVGLWSNPGEVVASPFMGVGSEGHQALKMGRRFFGTELKESYFGHACRYLREAERDAQGFGQLSLEGFFGRRGAAAE